MVGHERRNQLLALVSGSVILPVLAVVRLWPPGCDEVGPRSLGRLSAGASGAIEGATVPEDVLVVLWLIMPWLGPLSRRLLERLRGCGDGDDSDVLVAVCGLIDHVDVIGWISAAAFGGNERAVTIQ